MSNIRLLFVGFFASKAKRNAIKKGNVLWSNFTKICGLVPDNTVHKGTNKHHKTDKKKSSWGTRSFINIWSKKFSPLHSASIQLCSGLTKIPVFYGETYTALLLVLFWLDSYPKNNYILLELSFFGFILVHTWVRPARNSYIIIFTTRKHHLPRCTPSTFIRLFIIFSV